MTALHCGSTTIILVFFYTSRHPSIGRFSRVVESNSSPNSCNYVKIKHQNKNNVYPNQCISLDLYLRIKTSSICSTIQYVICRFFFTTVYHYRSLNAKDLTDYNNYFHHCHYYDTAVLQCILIRDFKIGHYGRLGQLDRCHTIQNMHDLLTSSFWDSMFSPGFSL